MTGKKIILDQTLTDIADAIRIKTGGSSQITPADMPDEIESIPTGGDEAPVIILTDGGAHDATAVTVKTVGSVLPTSLAGLFQSWTKIISVDMSELKADLVTDVSSMFSAMTALRSVIYPSTGFPSIVKANTMFANCPIIDTIDLSAFDFSHTTEMINTFNGCRGIRTLDLSGHDLSHVVSIMNMFNSCAKLETVNLQDVDFSAVTNTSNAFIYCATLKKVDLSSKLAAVTSMTSMFQSCDQLTEVDLSGCDLSHITQDNRFSNTFAYTPLLETIKTDVNTVFPGVNMATTFKGSTALSVQSVRNIFNALPTVTGKTIKFEAAVYNRLSADDIAIATGKGWTVTS